MKLSILKHPLVTLGGLVLGIVIGLFNAPLSSLFRVDDFAKIISFPGDLYIFFLQMTVIPIVVTAIAASLGKLMKNKSSAKLIGKIVAVFFLFMVVCALLGMAFGAFGKPGTGLGSSTDKLLTELLPTEHLKVELSSKGVAQTESAWAGLIDFFANMIPSNIFNALSLGSIMAILFFSIIFGIAIGFLPDNSANLLIELCTALFEAFQKLIGWSLYLLPIGLVCLLAGQVASMGMLIFLAMSKFIIFYCAITIIVFIICTVIIWTRSKISSPVKVISLMFEPIFLAFATRNSMATLPSAINCLEQKMGFNSTSVNLTLPLGITMGRFGYICYFALGVFFIGQIYNAPFGFSQYLLIFIGSIFAGTATAGAPGLVALSMLSIVLNPLSLPMEAVLIIFIAINSITDPFITVFNMYTNVAATSLIANCAGNAELSAIEAAMADAERRIQRSFRAKVIGSADENDEKMFKQINEEIERLREQKRKLLEEIK